jgi:two-component system response regulator
MERSILLVEDDDADAELTMHAFESAGVRTPIVRLRDGHRAIAYLVGEPSQEPKQLPFAVLLDLGLPGASGLDVLKAIRKHDRTRHLPVIVMTSSAHDTDRFAAFDEGAMSFVRKPVNVDEFIRAVKTIGLHWLPSISVFGTAD